MDTPTLIGTGFVVIGLVVWVVCAIYAYRTAPRFGRSATTWGILGIILGPIALMILYVLPKAHGGGSTSTGGRSDPRADLYEVPHKKKD